LKTFLYEGALLKYEAFGSLTIKFKFEAPEGVPIVNVPVVMLGETSVKAIGARFEMKLEAVSNLL